MPEQGPYIRIQNATTHVSNNGGIIMKYMPEHYSSITPIIAQIQAKVYPLEAEATAEAFSECRK